MLIVAATIAVAGCERQTATLEIAPGNRVVEFQVGGM
jgi:hypothetical protein